MRNKFFIDKTFTTRVPSKNGISIIICFSGELSRFLKENGREELQGEEL